MDTKPLLFQTDKGVSIKYNNRFIYSKYAPVKGAEKFISDLILTEETMFLIPSPLLGYGLNILKEKMPTNSILILIEVDEDLLNLSDSNLNIKLIKNGFDFITLLNTLDFSLFKKCKLIQLNGAYEIFKQKYNTLFNILLNQLHNYWKNRYTQTQLGQLWIKNTLVNLKTLKNSKPLSDIQSSKPVVIIGAGESTETVLTLISDNRKEIYILCVDTALQILLDVDIVPDAVLALEAQYYNLPDFYGAKDRKIDLIYDLSSYPAVPRNLVGEKYYCVTQFSNSSLLNKIKEAGIVNEFMPPLGSVGISALYIGMQITDNYIFLAGLDFSYKLGKTHSKGTPYHKTSLISWNKINPGDCYINCLKRPLLTKPNKISIDENTDSILYDYSLHAKELLFGNNKVFDITNRGMDLGVPIIDHNKFLAMIIQDSIQTKKELLESSDNALSLFNNEWTNLNKAISILYQCINGDLESSNCFENLKQIDYFFEHYPESRPLEDLNMVKLKRLYFTLLRYKKQIS